MALDTVNKGNFNTSNPEEAVRLIENLASCTSTKNTNFERRDSVAALWKEQMDDVKVKLDNVYRLLRNQVSLIEDVEIIDVEDDRNNRRHVDFIRTFYNSSFLEGQLKLTLDFNGKIVAVCTNLNSKLEALNVQLKKVEVVRRQEALVKGKR